MEDTATVIGGLMGISLIVFVTFVMPIWIFMHYKHRARQQPVPIAPSVSSSDAADLVAIADRMEQRVTALEGIMDAEAPGWRAKS